MTKNSHPLWRKGIFSLAKSKCPWYSLLTLWSETKRHPRIQFRPIVFFAEVEDERLLEIKDYLWSGGQLLVAYVCRCDGALMLALIRALPDMEAGLEVGLREMRTSRHSIDPKVF